MKKIKLTKGYVALVDNEDFESVSKIKWSVIIQSSGRCEAMGNIGYGRKNTDPIRMHTLIMNPPKGMTIDHINHNALDNRKSNLRICTNRQNNRNKKAPSNNTSGFKGVVWHKGGNKWMAQIRIDNDEHLYLGLFKDKIAAAKAYNEAALKHHGEFAFLNEI